MYFKKLLLLCSFLTLFLVGTYAQSTQGTDFWVAFLQNCDFANGDGSKDFYLLEMKITSQRACTVKIESDSSGYSKTINLPANGVETISVPFETYNLNVYGEAVKKTFHVTSSDSISVYAANSQLCSMEASLILPTSACGSYYITQMNTVRIPAGNYKYMPAAFAVLAVDDNTEIEITPSLKTSTGQSEKVPFTIKLNKGEVYALKTTSDDQGKDFSGSQIRVKDNKKVAVFVGNTASCVPEPTSAGDGDNLWDVAYPVSSWGKKCLIVPMKTCKNELIKITAADKGATVYMNKEKLADIKPFESYQFIHKESDGAFTIESNEPIAVYQYMTSSNYISRRGYGGPSYQYVAPLEQAISEVTFSTFNTKGISDHYLSFIINEKDKNSVTLDGKTNFTTFSSLDNEPGFLFASLLIRDGSHVLKAPHGVIANIYGTGSDISYAYSAGSRMEVINMSSQYKVTYDGNGATSGSMNDHIYSISVNETTQLDANTFDRSYNISFDTKGGNVIPDQKNGYTFAGWMHDDVLTEVSNNMAENWSNISTDNYGRTYDLITLSNSNDINTVSVNPRSSIRERLYSKPIYTPEGDFKLMFKTCSPSGYADLGATWDIKFKVAVCDQEQEIYCNDLGLLTKNGEKSAALLDCYTASNTMVDRDLMIYALGTTPVYITINCGNLEDGSPYEFKFSDFEIKNADGSSLTYSDKELTKNIIREEGGVVALKAIWKPDYLTLPLPIKDGFIFNGWNTKEDGTGTSYQANESIHVDANTKLYAIWLDGCAPTHAYVNETICGNQYYTSVTGKQYHDGVHIDTIPNKAGCDSLIHLTLTSIPVPVWEIVEEAYLNEPYSGYGLDLAELNDLGTYDLYATLPGASITGCDSIVHLMLTVKERPIEIPTAFTPYDNDDLNDHFMRGYEVYIYDRYSNLICHSMDGWDGTYHGKIATPGVYVYFLFMKDGEQRKGTIEVVKSKK